MLMKLINHEQVSTDKNAKEVLIFSSFIFNWSALNIVMVILLTHVTLLSIFGVTKTMNANETCHVMCVAGKSLTYNFHNKWSSFICH